MDSKTLRHQLVEFAENLEGHAGGLDGQMAEIQVAANRLGNEWNTDASELVKFCITEAATLRGLAIKLRRLADQLGG